MQIFNSQWGKKKKQNQNCDLLSTLNLNRWIEKVQEMEFKDPFIFIGDW